MRVLFTALEGPLKEHDGKTSFINTLYQVPQLSLGNDHTHRYHANHTYHITNHVTTS
jgi:hypothetical protein